VRLMTIPLAIVRLKIFRLRMRVKTKLADIVRRLKP